jgi:hypothetical protein
MNAKDEEKITVLREASELIAVNLRDKHLKLDVNPNNPLNIAINKGKVRQHIDTLRPKLEKNIASLKTKLAKDPGNARTRNKLTEAEKALDDCNFLSRMSSLNWHQKILDRLRNGRV